MSETILQFDSVTYTYPKSERGIAGFNLSLAEGERIALVGESGSGKSTVARLGLGLLRPKAGRVSFAGTKIPGRGRRGRRKFRGQVPAVFQDPYSSLDPRMRVGETVAEPLRALHLASGQAARERVREALALVDVDPDRADEYPRTFSGGQRQRIAIARALVSQPKVLVADEPVSALDMATRASVMEMVEQITRSRGTALLLVSHDLATVASTCERILVLQGGRLVETGTTQQVLGAPSQDYTRQLLASIPRLPA